MKHMQLVMAGIFASFTLAAQAALVVNEANYSGGTFPDENGETPDWLELYNSGPDAVNIGGYWLTDTGAGDSSPTVPGGAVVLPNHVMPVGSYLVIYADGTDTVTWADVPDVEAIPSNSEWKYYAGASAPYAGWMGVSFNDATWESGTSPLGYNPATENLDCATVLPSGTAAFFRKSFTIQSQGTVTGLLVRARINDGAAFYFNGEEVHSINIPVAYNVPPTQWHTFMLPASLLRTGENLFAVEVHRAANGTDLTFDLSLTALVTGQMPYIHAPFNLGSDSNGKGEKIHLYHRSGTRLQKFNDNNMLPSKGRSIGLVTDGIVVNKGEVEYPVPTPGLPNNTQNNTTTETLTPPSFSVAPGFYASPQTVTITASGQTIKYTLDGSNPLTSPTAQTYDSALPIGNATQATGGLAWIRTNPVEITNKVDHVDWRQPIGTVIGATVLRAVAVSPDGKECSAERRGTYFIGATFANRTLPVVSLITEKENLFGFAEGLYIPGKFYADSAEGFGSNKWGKPHANYHQTNSNQAWERPAYLELFEPTAPSAAFALTAGVAMHGGGTRAIPQKALYFLARGSEYGSSHFNYPLFPEMPAVTNYKRFLLRNSGNDWYGPDFNGTATMLKDAVLQRITANLDFSMQAYRPAVLYINGEYWGLHNMRESLDKHYLATRYGLNADNIDLLMHEEGTGNNVKITRIDGDKNSDEEYEELLDWIFRNSLVYDTNVAALDAEIDIANLTDYIIAETFFANTDWPINNCDFWRAHTVEPAAGKHGDTRWRWMLYDLDLAGEKGALYNMFDYLSSNKMTGKSEPGYIINQLWLNTGYCGRFVDRYTALLNTTFRPERMTNIIETAALAIEPEIERHFRRWGRTTTQAQWRNAVQTVLKDFTTMRHTATWNHLKTKFSLGNPRTLTVANADPSGIGGHFIVGGITITPATDGVTTRAIWTGTFFDDKPVTIQAVADAGYVFDGWVGTTLADATREFPAGTPASIYKARFRLAGAGPHTPVGFEAWQLDPANTFTEQEILRGVAAPAAPSGRAGFTNHELYAFGMTRSDGLTDAQRHARKSLSIHNRAGGLWLGFHQRRAHPDLAYTLQVADQLGSATAWRAAMPGAELTRDTATNGIDASTFYHEKRVAPSAARSRFFRLEVVPQ